MTYPPQPPDPYGAHGGYGQSPSEHYPQYGYLYGQHPYGQHPYGRPAQPGQQAQPGSFGGPPPPPKKSRAGLWTGVSVAAAAVVAFLVTAFVTPGFLLGDDGGPGRAARATAFALDAHDRPALRNLTCRDATRTVRAAIGAADEVESARLRSVRQLAPGRAVAAIAVRAGGMQHTIEATFAEQQDDWCWQDISLTSGIAAVPRPSIPRPTPGHPNRPPTSAPAVPAPPGGSDHPAELADARKAIERFLTAVNGADQAAAADFTCAGRSSTIGSEVEQLSADGARLELHRDSLIGVDRFVNATLYVDDEQSGSVSVRREHPADDYCVSFFAYY